MVFCRDDEVALLATISHRGVDEPALFFLGMTGQAGLRLDVSWLDIGVLELFLGSNSERREETNN